MKVLFVDDEPRVLQGIERVLFDVSDFDVDASFASSGEQALQMIEGDRYDAVISDMRMPGMTGEDLLMRVKHLHPAVMRIVLTGDCEVDAALRMSKQAHQFLSKPCTPEMLTDMLRRAACMRKLLKNDALLETIGGIDALPAAPSMWVELNTLLASPDVVIDSAVALIRRDPAMSAKVLQLANSAVFGARQPLSDPKVAVMRLGLRSIRGLVLAAGVFASESITKPGLDLDAMQRRALQAGVLAQELCEIEAEKDTAFTAALLTGIGALLVDDEALHAEAGAYLLGLWGLPVPVIEAVAQHHVAVEELRLMDAAASVFVACALIDDETERLKDIPWCQTRKMRFMGLLEAKKQ